MNVATKRVAAVAVALFVVTVAGTTSAIAMLQARATGTGTVSTGTWSVVPTVASAAPYPTGALSLSFARKGNQAPAPAYFWLVGTGTFPVTAISTTVTTSPAVTARVEVCSGSWNETTGVCTGTVTVLDTTTAGASTTATTFAVGERRRAKASITQGLTGTTTMSVGVAVPRTAVRAGTETSS